MAKDTDHAAKALDVGFMDELYLFFMLVAVGLGLAVYLLCVRNRHYWVIMETLLGVVSLLLLPFADSMIESYQSTGTNPLSVHLFRYMVFTRVSQAATIFLTRNSTDRTVATCISLTNILSRGAVLMCAIHGLLYTTTITKKNLTTDAIMTILLLVGDCFQLSKHTIRDGCMKMGDPISVHLSIDGIVKFVLGSLMFGFPDIFIALVNPDVSPSEGQIALARITGCFTMGPAILSFGCLCFKHEEDVINIFKAKLAFYLPAILFGLVMYVMDSSYRELAHVVAVIGTLVVLATNAGYTVWKHEKEKME